MKAETITIKANLTNKQYNSIIIIIIQKQYCAELKSFQKCNIFWHFIIENN